MENNNKEISAFAFNIGRLIEQSINHRINSVETNYKFLQAQLFNFRHIYLNDNPELAKKFDEHFRIVNYKNGK